MKIAVILQTYPSPTETFIAREIQALERADVDLRVISLDAETYTVAAIAGQTCLEWVCRPRLSRAAYRIIRENQHAEAGGLLRALRHAGTAMCVARDLSEWAPDLVHAHFLGIPADVAAAVAHVLGIPLTLAAHARDIYVPPRDAVRIRALRARRILVCTDHGRETLAMISEEIAPRTRLMRHGLAPEELEVPAATGDALIAVGRLVPKKGFATLIRACASLRARGETPRVRIVGEGPDRGVLEGLIRDAGLGSSVELLGAVQADAMAALYADARVLVAPSVLAEDGDRDGVPNVVLEAMAHSVPTIVSNGAAAAEVVLNEKNGLVVPAGDAEALAEAVHRIFADDEMHHRLASAARKSVVSMRVDDLVAPMVAEFEAMVAAG